MFSVAEALHVSISLLGLSAHCRRAAWQGRLEIPLRSHTRAAALLGSWELPPRADRHLGPCADGCGAPASLVPDPSRHTDQREQRATAAWRVAGTEVVAAVLEGPVTGRPEPEALGGHQAEELVLAPALGRRKSCHCRDERKETGRAQIPPHPRFGRDLGASAPGLPGQRPPGFRLEVPVASVLMVGRGRGEAVKGSHMSLIGYDHTCPM